MATAAVVLANISERRLEGIQVLYAYTRGLGVAAELGKPRSKVFHALPYFRTGAVRIVRTNSFLRKRLSIPPQRSNDK